MPQQQIRSRSRLRRGLLGLGLSAAMVAASVVAAPQASAAPETEFWTSFEATEPQAQENQAKDASVNFTGSPYPDTSLLSLVTEATSPQESPAGEAPPLAADNNSATKWLSYATSTTLTYKLSEPAHLTSYNLTSANDAPDRDPRDFKVEGSTDGTNWVTLDTRTGQVWKDARGDNRFTTKEFDLGARTEAFSYYRLNVTANQGAAMTQLADWGLFDSERVVDPEPMSTKLGSGPTSSYTAKTGVGWTGVKSLMYEGRVQGDGDASASNVLFDVDVEIAEDTQLSYKIFPVLDQALTYASTHVAVDLVLDDGTRLSGSGAKDIYGFVASPRGQGEGKILYPDQWNSVKVDLSQFAGRRVTQVLLGYSQAGAPAGTTVRGWVDDIALDEPAPRDTTDGLISYVDTRRATNSTGGFSRGNNLPATAWPNGFNFITPMTTADTHGTIYHYQQANNAANRPMLAGVGFSHAPSIWMGDRNQLATMPTSGDAPSGAINTRRLPFSHDNEVARPDRYTVHFDNGMVVDTTATDHGGVFRYTFPGDLNSVIVDQVENSSGLNISATGAVTGWVDGGSGWPGRTRMFVAGQFDATPTKVGIAADRTTGRFAAFNTSQDKTVELRIATSFISQDQAAKNLALELTGRSFEELQKAVRDAWNDRLSVITDVQGARDWELVNLYSGLYRLNLYPNSQFENVGTADAPRYRYASPVSPTTGAATATRTNAKIVDGKIYVNNGFWDTYRTAWPLYAMLYPDLANELVDGFVQQYRDGGWIARWSSPGYADLMTGTSSDVAFAEAYLAGSLSNAVALDAYDAALKNGTVLPPGNNVGRKGIERSIFLGFTEANTHESASWGLEGFINDYGIANMARALAEDPETPQGRVAQLREEAEYFAARANHFVEMYNPNAGVFTQRNADGSWPEKFDKLAWGGAFTEASGWTFAFHAPHNVDGLAALYGGRRGLMEEFKEFLSTPETAKRSSIHEAREARDVRLGMLGLSNQIAHHIPYVLAEGGDPSGAQALIHDVMQRLFAGSDIGQGFPGDEDNGEFSSWYVFSTLGFYPLKVGSGDYTIGTPSFDSVTVNLAGKPLTIKAPGAGLEDKFYVAGLSHNGQALSTTTIDGDLVRSGGTLEFEMSDQPAAWGAKDLDEPLEVPQVLVDATKPDYGTLVATDGTTVGKLVDDDMRTNVTFPGSTAELTWTSVAGAVRVDQYTLTNTAVAAGNPVAWTLEGSNNGEDWTQLDARTNQKFKFLTQTRPFSVPGEPGAYSQFRLRLNSADGSKLALSEVELFAASVEQGDLSVQARPDQRVRVGNEFAGKVALVTGGSMSADSTVTVNYGDGQGPQAATLTRTGLGGWEVTAPHTFTAPGVYSAVVQVTDDAGATASVTTMVTAYVDNTLVGQFNNVCIGDLNKTAGNCDAQGSSYFRDKLAADGFVQGETLTVPGTDLTYDLPAVPAGQPDNVTGEGQTIQLDLGEGATKISFIGTSTEKGRQVEATLTFSDGSTQVVPFGFGDWVGSTPNPQYGNISIAISEGRLSGTAAESTIKNTSIFATAPFTLATDEAGQPKHVVSVTLPKEPGTLRNDGRAHIFAIASDGDRSDAADLTVTPAEDLSGFTGEAIEGELATVAGGSGATLTATVNWGDGTNNTAGTIADGKVTGSHSYAAAGTYTVWVTVSDGTVSRDASLQVVVKDPALTGIAVTEAPTTVEYFVGQPLDLAGLVVTATFDDGSTEVVPVSELEVKGYDAGTVGEQTVTVAYTAGGVTKEASFKVSVVPIVLTGIRIDSPPVKTDYFAGQELDPSGLVVFAEYSDGSEKELAPEDLVLSGYDAAKVGQQTVTVAHTEDGVTKEASFTVNVAAVVLDGLTITSPPAKTAYTVGDKLDLAGLQVSALYSDGSSKPVPTTSLAVSGFDPNKAGKQTVTVAYTEAGVTHSATFEVSVAAKPKPSPSPTTTPPTSPKPTPKPPVLVAPYEVPGFHVINGRSWYTTCEPYSQTLRCRTDIWATQVTQVNGRFVQKTGWVFNNLTYLPFMTRAQWASNPLGHTGSWTATDGRRWRTECDTAATGKNACRSYIWTRYVASAQNANGTWRHFWTEGWVFNNLVRFKVQ